MDARIRMCELGTRTILQNRFKLKDIGGTYLDMQDLRMTKGKQCLGDHQVLDADENVVDQQLEGVTLLGRFNEPVADNDVLEREDPKTADALRKGVVIVTVGEVVVNCRYQSERVSLHLHN